MPTTQRKHKAEISKGPAMSAAEFFRAKLAYETTPHDVKRGWDAGTMAIVDVRDAESFKKEHIPGAINIPIADLGTRLAELPKNKTLVTYCWNITCSMGTKAALFLAEKGFKVSELVGGIAEWKGKFPAQSA